MKKNDLDMEVISGYTEENKTEETKSVDNTEKSEVKEKSKKEEQKSDENSENKDDKKESEVKNSDEDTERNKVDVENDENKVEEKLQDNFEKPKNSFLHRNNPKKEKKEKIRGKKKEKDVKTSEVSNNNDNSDDDLDFKPLGKKRWWQVIIDIIYFIVMLPFRFVAWVFSAFRFAFNFLMVLFVLGSIAGVLVIGYVTPMLQEAREEAYEKLANLSEDDFVLNENTVIYDTNGKKIGEIESGKFTYVTIDQISENIQHAYVAIEDKQFYLHAGVNLKSLTRAALSLVSNNGTITQGGSTITQQLIKNNLLSQEQTYSRKLVELMLAPYVEQKFSKAQIMEYYCNSNYYGNQCYGVEAACQYYLGKSATEVSISEAAMIAGISNAPNDYNPIDDYDKAIQRRDKVLKEMKEEGYIDQEQYDVAISEQMVIHTDDSKTASSSNYMASYALYCTALELMKEDGFKFQYTFETEDEYNTYQEQYEAAYAEKARTIRDGGYKIYTSLDSSIQKKLQNYVKEGLAGYVDKDEETGKYALQGAAVCVDNTTGYVVAIVGGRSSKDEYNRAFLSTRQPGSTIKPLVDYAPAIENVGMNGSSIVEDKQVYATNGDDTSWSPKNYGGGYKGKMTMREALARSINTVAFQLYQKVGSGTALNYLAEMQYSSLSSVDNTASSVSLGGFTNGVKVVDMAKGYSTLAMNGKYSDRNCLVKVTYRDEDVFTEKELEDTQTEVYTEDTAFIMQDMMQGVFNESYGTAHSAYNKNQVYAGKTGTTSDNKDAWFCGFSKYYTTAVWMGYDTPKEMAGVTGSSYPLTIWKNFMNDMHTDLAKADFTPPDTVELRKVSNGEFTDTSTELSSKDDKDKDSDEEDTEDTSEEEETDEKDSDSDEEETKVSKSEKKYTYYKRKKGYDYFSTLNTKKAITYQNEQELKKAYRRCENKVAEFELYSIETVEDALGLDDAYEEVMNIVESMPDVYKQKDFRTRAKKKYDDMASVIDEVWTQAIEEYNEQEKLLREEEMAKQTDDARTSGYKTLKTNRLSRVEWFISALNGRKYYNKLTKLLIKDGTSALARLKGYSEYDDYKERLESAVEYAKNLPDEPEYNDIPSNSSDTETDKDREDKYTEQQTTTEKKTEATTQPVTEATTEVPTEATTEMPVQMEIP
jgi:penicillin-binding protein 1A